MKRILSFLLALVLVLSMVPVSVLTAQEVSAEPATPSPSEHTHDSTWKVWDGSQITTSGKYYLNADNLSAALIDKSVTGVDVTVCLNGHNLKAASGNRLFYIGSNTKITICDCKATMDASGKLTSANKIQTTNAAGGVACFASGSTGNQLIVDRVVMDGTGMSTYVNGCHGILSWSAAAQISLTNCIMKNFGGGGMSGGNVVNTYPGGAISLITGGHLTASKVWFENNKTDSVSAGAGAGAIYAPAKSAITLTDCTFDGNSDSKGSGGITMNGGSLTATNVVFKKNTNKATTGYGGGAILVTNNATKLTLTGCSFEQNSAYQGGAVAINNGNDENSFTNCTFTKNSALDAGGAALLWAEGKKVSFTGCTFEENSAARGSVILGNQIITLNDCIVKNNTTTGIGAINTSKDVNVSGGTQIYGNAASDAKKADLYLSSTNKLVLGNMTGGAKINVANTAEATDPDAFMVWDPSATPTGTTGVSYTLGESPKTVAYNAAENFYFWTKTLVSDHDHSGEWIAWGDDAAEKTSLPTVAGKYYLVADINPAGVNQKDLTPADITICLNGKTMTAANNDRLYRVTDGNTMTVCDCTAVLDTDGYLVSAGKIVPNKAPGGAFAMSIYTNGNANTLNLENIIIDGQGVTNPNGGSVVETGNSKTTVNLTNCIIRNTTSTGANGGAFRLQGGTLNAEKVKFLNNTLTSPGSGTRYGGAVITASSGGPKLQLTDCWFEGNTTNYQGGAIAINYGNAENTITGCTFKDNSAGNLGGAILLTSSNLTISGSTFTGNSLGGTNRNGGAIYTHASSNTLKLDNCTIEGTTTSGLGAVCAAGPVIVSGNTKISGNTASDAKKADLYLSGTNKLVLGTLAAEATINVATATETGDANTFLAWADTVTPADSADVQIRYTNAEPAKTAGYNKADDKFYFVTGEEHDQYHTGWIAWGDDAAEKTSLPTASGKYYLVDNINPTAGVDQRNHSAANITICMCSKKITAPNNDRLYRIVDGNSLTICDCTAVLDADGYPVTAGVLVPNKAPGGAFALTIYTNGNSNALTLENVIIDGQNVTNPNGGSVAETNNSKCNLTMNNCVVRNTTNATANGGAFRLQGGNFTANKVKFENNTLTSPASGTRYGGSVITAVSGGPKIQMTDCLFVGNTSTYQGGVMSINNGNDASIFTNCIFRDNTAGNVGGVALVWGTASLTFDGCTFTSNTGSAGSVIYANRPVTLKDCTVTGNTATGIGAINTSSTLTVVGNTVIDNNTAADAKTANAYLSGSNKLIVGQLADTAKIVVSTAATAADPDTFMEKAASLALADTADTHVVYGNNGKTVAYKTSKLFYFYSSLPAHEHYACACVIGATGCTHTTEPAIEWEPWGDDEEEKTSLPTGTGNYYLTQDIDLTKVAGSGVTYTIASGAEIKLCMNGKNILCDQNNELGAAYYVNGGKLFIMNCAAKLNADGMLDMETTAGGKISGAKGNAAGALRTAGATAKLELLGVIIADSKVPTIKYSNQGGALMVGGGKVDVSYCRFENNSSARQGGAIMVDAYLAAPPQLTVNNTAFVGNETPIRGGAIGIYVGKQTGADFQIRLTDCLFEGNKAWSGGAISIECEKATPADREIDLVINGCTFNENSVTENGGAIEAQVKSESQVTILLEDSALTGNTAKQGGAVYGENTRIGISGSSVKNNKATAGGGAVVAKGGILAAAESAFNENEITNTSGYGGAAVLIPEGGTQLYFEDCTFEGNKSAYQGGAFAISNGNDDNLFINCTFKKNSAPDAGGAMLLWHDGKKITFEGCTFEDNTAARGSVMFSNQEVFLKDCVVKNNTTTGTVGGAINTSGDLHVAGNTVIYSNTAKVAENANLYLSAKNNLIVGQLADTAQIGVSTGSRGKDVTDPDQIMQAEKGVTLTDAENTGILFTNYLPGKQVGYKNDKKVQFYFTDVTVGEHKDHGACACVLTGSKCAHEEVKWEPWPYNDRLPTMGGNYYLTADVDLTQAKGKGKPFTVTGDVKLCLNGKNIKCDQNNTLGYAYDVANGQLTIMNCYTKLDANGKLDTATTIGGKISGATGSVAGVLRVTGAKAELNVIGVTFADNKISKRTYSNQGGAAMLIGGGKATVNYCYFSNNTTDRIGGAILVDTYVAEPPAVTIENTTFVKNTAEAYGGAIGVYVGVKTAKSFEMSVKNCYFEGNRAYDGGAICIEGEYATPETIEVTLNVEGCKFVENGATNQGGGICIKGHGPRKTYLNIKDCTFTTQKARQGAGLHVLFTNVNADNLILEKGMCSAGGGALYANKSDVKITNSQINENDNPKSRCAAVTINDECTLEMENCRLYKNMGHPKGDGGAMRFERSSQAVLTNCVFEANEAQSGGAISILRDCTVELNGCTFKNNKAGTYGGAIMSTTWQPEDGEEFLLPVVILNNSKFYGNTCRWNGGAIRMINSKLVMNSGTFSGNIAAEGAGGAVAVEGSKDTKRRAEFYFYGGSFVGNQGPNAGAIFMGIESDLYQYGGYVGSNKADQPKNANGSGGGLYLYGETRGYFYGGTYEDNWCESRGGAIFSSGKMYVYNITVQDNYSMCYGGGICVYDGEGMLFENGLIQENVAAVGGGGMMIRSDTQIKGGKIINNRIEPTEEWKLASNKEILKGAGVYLSDEGGGANNSSIYYQRFIDLDISGGEISGNYTPGCGGGLYMAGRHTVTMTGGVIKNNIAGDMGGGVMMDNHPSHMRAAKSIFRLIDGEISGNQATDGAGVASRYCAYPDLQGGVIKGNVATGTGGGIYLGRGTNAQLSNVLITENRAAKAAGMYFMDDTVMKDLTITGNDSGDGYAVYLERGDYDGESYVMGIIKMSGNMIVADNKGTKPDMFIGKGSQIIVGNDGMGKDTLMNIDLEEGVLTSTVLGAYNYEGGNLSYVLTAGDRSVTDIEYYEPATDEPEVPDETTAPTGEAEQPKGSLNIGAIAAISAVLVVAVIVILAVVAAKKKKKAVGAADETVQE